MGLDAELREVYIIGCGVHSRMLKKSFKGFGDLYGIDDAIFYVDASPWEGIVKLLVALSMKFPMIEPIKKDSISIGIKGYFPYGQTGSGWNGKSFPGGVTHETFIIAMEVLTRP